MDEQRHDGPVESILNSSVPILDVALETSREQWTIETGGERGSGWYVLVVQQDDDEYITNDKKLTIITTVANIHYYYYYCYCYRHNITINNNSKTDTNNVILLLLSRLVFSIINLYHISLNLFLSWNL